MREWERAIVIVTRPKGDLMPAITAPTRSELEEALTRAVSDYLACSRAASLHADEASWLRREEELWNEMMALREAIDELGATVDAEGVDSTGLDDAS